MLKRCLNRKQNVVKSYYHIEKQNKTKTTQKERKKNIVWFQYAQEKGKQMHLNNFREMEEK